MLLISAVLAASPATASMDKAIWGPVEVDGQSQFPVYRHLGVDIYQYGVRWDLTAPTRPADPLDPADPAYRWPGELDAAIAEASRAGIAISLTVSRSPGWANGGRSGEWAPSDPGDYADFVEAASRRYPTVRRWMIWGEPSRAGNFRPLAPRSKRGPRAYARLLDAAYVRLKRRSRRNVVIGGNTWTAGEISPVNWLRWMRLPNGRPPRLDLYGHNPFSRRRPRIADRPLTQGAVDFGSLDEFAARVDRVYRRKRVRFFLSEYTVPTGQPNHLFNFHESERTAASWLRSALGESRRYRRIAAFGWFGLYDEAPRPGGDETLYGLLRRDGSRKPAYYAFRRG